MTTEPEGMIERLHDGRSERRDLAYVEYRLGQTRNATEIKLLTTLRTRLLASRLADDSGPAHDQAAR